MNTQVIEVIIGVVLAFALVSLMATTVQELWTSGTSMRGKVLIQSIVSLVGDDKPFAQAIMDHPLIVSMAAQTQTERESRKPSYLKADVFVTALLGHLVDAYASGQRPATPEQLLSAIRSGAVPITAAQLAGSTATGPNDLFMRGMSALVMGVEHDWPAFEARLMAWYDAVGERATGWFKRKTQLGLIVIGTLLAASMNISATVIASRLWSDAPLRARVADMATTVSRLHEGSAVDAAVGLAASEPEVSHSLPPSVSRLPDEAHRLIEAMWTPLGALDQNVDMERKKAVGGMGESLASMQEDARQWLESPTGDSEARRVALLKKAIGLLGQIPASVSYDTLRPLAQELHRLLDVKPPAPIKAAETKASGSYLEAQLRRCLRETSASELSEQEMAFQSQLCTMKLMQDAGFPMGWSKQNQPYLFRDACDLKAGECQEGWRDYADYGLMFLGWLMMGLAATLGAPFWFDALGKLTRLRASGAKPEEKTGGTDAAGGGGSGKGVLTPPSSPTAPAGSGAGTTDLAFNDHEHALSIMQVQRIQRVLGMAELELTGLFDDATRTAIQAWQERRQAGSGTGQLTELQIIELLQMPVPQASISPTGAAANSGSGPASDSEEFNDDCCGKPPEVVTDNADLPAASGGVAST